MGPILAKHMCEVLLNDMEEKFGPCAVRANRNEWHFPQLVSTDMQVDRDAASNVKY